MDRPTIEAGRLPVFAARSGGWVVFSVAESTRRSRRGCCGCEGLLVGEPCAGLLCRVPLAKGVSRSSRSKKLTCKGYRGWRRPRAPGRRHIRSISPHRQASQYRPAGDDSVRANNHRAALRGTLCAATLPAVRAISCAGRPLLPETRRVPWQRCHSRVTKRQTVAVRDVPRARRQRAL